MTTEKKHYNKKSIASSLQINLPLYTPTSNDRIMQVNVPQYIKSRVITADDAKIFYQLKYSHKVLSKALIKSVIHEYFDNVLSFNEIGKMFSMPESMVKQLVDLAY